MLVWVGPLRQGNLGNLYTGKLVLLGPHRPGGGWSQRDPDYHAVKVALLLLTGGCPARLRLSASSSALKAAPSCMSSLNTMPLKSLSGTLIRLAAVATTLRLPLSQLVLGFKWLPAFRCCCCAVSCCCCICVPKLDTVFDSEVIADRMFCADGSAVVI